jgi:hypothetical protein
MINPIKADSKLTLNSDPIIFTSSGLLNSISQKPSIFRFVFISKQCVAMIYGTCPRFQFTTIDVFL